ncbi:uncharacterized protein PG998_014481 [Apiospora kogelbergensis]|uniref:uncharacterized protein n=1 Tax=Apiospora kogelbergensis TaxID=1337665 RepID=UPI00312D3D72
MSVTSKTDYQVASLAAGFSLGFGILTVWEVWKQTRRNKNPLRSTYIWMLWGEIVANLVLGVLAYLFLNDNIHAGVPIFFVILVCWVFEIQLLMQIIVNRIAVISETPKTVSYIRWGTVGIISSINIAVFIIFIPAHLEHPLTKAFVEANKYWDKISKFLICFIDVGLNWYFLRIVKQRLVKYYGLKKYAPLAAFNAKLMVLSVGMDILLIGLMFLPNQTVFIQFHPVVYIVKLNIEMAMANLIRKLAQSGHGDDMPDSGGGSSHPYGYGTDNFRRGHNQDRELTTYTRTIDNKGPSRPNSSAGSDDSSFVGGTQKTMNYNVTIEDAPNAATRKQPHIGVKIDASEIRLITSEKDAYGWQRLPEAEPLFAKHLSDHSVGAYTRICEGVGRTFEAVVSPHYNGEEVHSIGKTSGDGTFTSRTNSLAGKIDRLESELRGCNESLQVERHAREKVDNELVNMRKDYENQRVKLDEAISISVQLELVNARYEEKVLSIRKALEE